MTDEMENRFSALKVQVGKLEANYGFEISIWNAEHPDDEDRGLGWYMKIDRKNICQYQTLDVLEQTLETINQLSKLGYLKPKEGFKMRDANEIEKLKQEMQPYIKNATPGTNSQSYYLGVMDGLRYAMMETMFCNDQFEAWFEEI